MQWWFGQICLLYDTAFRYVLRDLQLLKYFSSLVFPFVVQMFHVVAMPAKALFWDNTITFVAECL